MHFHLFCAQAFCSCIYIFFSLSYFYAHFVVLLHLVAHLWHLYWCKSQVIIFVFSLLLHYSFRCHFCSILSKLRAQKQAHIGRSCVYTKNTMEKCNVFEMSNKFLWLRSQIEYSLIFMHTSTHVVAPHFVDKIITTLEPTKYL